LIAASIAESPTRLAHAQIGQLAGAGGMAGGAGVGQSAMGSAAGLVNGAMARLGDLEENGPGWLYYGVNAADRGLGYRGSYYTMGGFIPYAEDDLGGVWSADLRGHLSNFGGFFSNVGAVRKQFWGGTIFGLGVFWDYDGDQNQYSDTTITDTSGSYVFSGGETYQQVGVSAEWLTDYGNLRSNGYIPVGTTATTMGPFVGNSLLCQDGINAGLAGADLEVGAYIPGLADWAGMVSVGGYAFGNARYNNVNGNDVVPYFGGVYSRLDLTLVRNWDLSLQANNDSFFDWTGFARLTYRMGGSRRRNVPDQMEQPMMRNEHVVRTHQAPEQALNPNNIINGQAQPYQVFHVDNETTTVPSGNGTWENPYTTLEQARNNATADYDIVFVHIGQGSAVPYETPMGGYTFLANNQYLVGEGTSLKLETANCGLVNLWSKTSQTDYPVITNPMPGEAAIVLTDPTKPDSGGRGTRGGATVDHLRITGSPVGISDGIGLPAGQLATNVNDVQIFGNGQGQRGVEITKSDDARISFTKMNIQNMTNDGFYIAGSGTGGPIVNIERSTINNTGGSGVIVNDVGGSTARVRVADSRISNSSNSGVFVASGNAFVGTTAFSKNVVAGVYVQDSTFVNSGTGAPGTSNVQVDQSSFKDSSVGVWAVANSGTTNITITSNSIATTAVPSGANGIILAVGTSEPPSSLPGTGVMNAVVVNNKITPRIATQSTQSLTTSTTTGSGTGSTTTTSQVPVTSFSSVGNILIQTRGVPLVVSGTQVGWVDWGTLNIKAADQAQLESMNGAAGVATMPLPLLVGSGSAVTRNYFIPPPPYYDTSLQVPVPAP